ncbi:MAG: NAD(P)/FAD-dependent oxidoreductase [Thermoleophilaceae bacterium]
MAHSIVIAGGGFGGFYAARRLERTLPAQSARVTLVSDVNFLLYTPLLPGAAAGTLEPRHVVVPLREELRRTSIRIGTVTGAEPERRRLHYTPLGGGSESLDYDQLIIAIGSVSRVLALPGLAEHGLGLKTLSEAIALRNRTLTSLETAEAIDDPAERAAHLSFVFVGAGYAGVEGIAELQDYVADVIERYPRCREQGTRWTLIEAEQRIMPEIPQSLAAFATRELRARGIDIRTSTRLRAIIEDSVELSTGERIAARTVCWTAGVRPPQVVGELGLPLDDHGRIDSDSTLRVAGFDNVWAVGDAAAVPDPAKGRRQASPPTAQHAMREGKLAADNAAAALRGAGPRRFRYRTLGVFVDLGRHKAVATMLGLHLSGFPAWFAARTYHLAMMPGTSRRLRLMADWSVGLLFGRDSSELGQLGHPPDLGHYLYPPLQETPRHELAGGGENRADAASG